MKSRACAAAGDGKSEKAAVGSALTSNSRKFGVIRRAAFQKSRPAPILMITQRNFDGAAGFCRPLLSDRFLKAPIRSHAANLVSGASETPED